MQCFFLYKSGSFYLSRILSKYYQCQRKGDSDNAARTTIRLLESLIRLAQAHARLMFRSTVTVQDAVVAVTLLECSMQGKAILGPTDALHSKFPSNCGVAYKMQAELVLNKLELQDLLQLEFGS